MKNFSAKAEGNRGYRGILLTYILYWRTPIAPYKERGSMTREEAKNELREIKSLDSRIKSIELEIERLESVATKMTPNYDPDKTSTAYHNKIEEAVVKIDEYRGKLAKKLLEQLDHKNYCLNKIEKIEPVSLRQFLIFYYYNGKTIEEIAEYIDKTPRWTYELFCTALDKYAEIS